MEDKGAGSGGSGVEADGLGEERKAHTPSLAALPKRS